MDLSHICKIIGITLFIKNPSILLFENRANQRYYPQASNLDAIIIYLPCL